VPVVQCSAEIDPLGRLGAMGEMIRHPAILLCEAAIQVGRARLPEPIGP